MQVDQKIMKELDSKLLKVPLEDYSVELFEDLINHLHELAHYYNIDINVYEKLKKTLETFNYMKESLKGK